MRNCCLGKSCPVINSSSHGHDALLFTEISSEEYVERGIISTPALAINGKVILSGKYLPPDKLIEILQEY